jgi:hypothetical protein
MTDTKFLTADEVAERYRGEVSVGTLRNWRAQRVEPPLRWRSPSTRRSTSPNHASRLHTRCLFAVRHAAAESFHSVHKTKSRNTRRAGRT